MSRESQIKFRREDQNIKINKGDMIFIEKSLIFLGTFIDLLYIENINIGGVAKI